MRFYLNFHHLHPRLDQNWSNHLSCLNLKVHHQNMSCHLYTTSGSYAEEHNSQAVIILWLVQGSSTDLNWRPLIRSRNPDFSCPKRHSITILEELSLKLKYSCSRVAPFFLFLLKNSEGLACAKILHKILLHTIYILLKY